MKNKIIVPLFIALSVMSLALSLYSFSGDKQYRIAVVDIGKLYDSFQMKKELEKQYEGVRLKRQSYIDSLGVQLDLYSQRLKAKTQTITSEEYQKYDAMHNDYLTKKENYAQDNDAMASQYKQQIFTQLNQYVQNFGKEKGYNVIYGADGSGAVMYVDEVNNVTTDVASYINIHYGGSTK